MVYPVKILDPIDRNFYLSGKLNLIKKMIRTWSFIKSFTNWFGWGNQRIITTPNSCAH
jgi:hypothetical protein